MGIDLRFHEAAMKTAGFFSLADRYVTTWVKSPRSRTQDPRLRHWPTLVAENLYDKDKRPRTRLCSFQTVQLHYMLPSLYRYIRYPSAPGPPDASLSPRVPHPSIVTLGPRRSSPKLIRCMHRWIRMGKWPPPPSSANPCRSLNIQFRVPIDVQF